MMKLQCVLIFVFSATLFFSQQNVLITDDNNALAPDGSSLLELNSTSKGLLIPRVALTSITDGTTITLPSTSLLVYNTNNSIINGNGKGYYYNEGTSLAPQWVRIFASNTAGSDWQLLGNANTNPTNNFLGTIDNQDLVFRTNNTEKVRIMSGGNVGIGVSSPSFVLDVADRIQLRSGPSGSTAGVWFQNSTNSGLIGFFGTRDDNTVGLYGVGLNDWGLNMNRTSGNVGIGTASPVARLNVVGKSLFSRDNQTECCGSDETIAIAESSNSTGRQASISFHNGGEAEAFIRLAGGGSGARSGQRRLVIGDNQNSSTTLQIQGLAGTGNRPVFADANGILNVSTSTSVNNIGFYATKTSNQNSSNNNFVKVTWESVDFNDGNAMDLNNERFTVPAGQAGVYLFSAGLGSSTNTDSNPRMIVSIYVNGSEKTRIAQHHLDAMWWRNRAMSGSVVYKLNAGDYVEVFLFTSGSQLTLVPGEGCFFSGARIY
jgi:hypothetical protein